MSDCNKLNKLITLYCDDETTPEEKILVENHIQNCEKCKQKLNTMLKAKEVLKNSPQMPVPETLLKDFSEFKKKREESEKKIIPFYRNYRIYASVAAVFIFAFILKSGLLENDKFMTEHIDNQKHQKQTLVTPKITQKEEIELTNDTVIINQPAEEKKASATEEVAVQSRNTQVKTDEITADEVLFDASSSEQQTVENVPVVAALEDLQAEPATSGGGGSSSYARMMPDSETTENEELSEEPTEEAEAVIFVSEQFLQRATELLGDSTYLLYQAEQKLNENEIPFESNFLELDESKQYKITVTVIYE